MILISLTSSIWYDFVNDFWWFVLDLKISLTRYDFNLFNLVNLIWSLWILLMISWFYWHLCLMKLSIMTFCFLFETSLNMFNQQWYFVPNWATWRIKLILDLFGTYTLSETSLNMFKQQWYFVPNWAIYLNN